MPKIQGTQGFQWGFLSGSHFYLLTWHILRQMAISEDTTINGAAVVICLNIRSPHNTFCCIRLSLSQCLPRGFSLAL